MKKKIRVLLSKCGLEGHDRGILIIARALRDSGLEVIYIGFRVPPEEIVATAIQDDVDMVGISTHTGAHLEIFSEVSRLLREKTDKDWFIFGGGIIPREDIPELEEMGVKKIFLPGTSTDDIIKFISEALPMTNKKRTEARPLYDLLERTRKGEVWAASKLMTLVQRDGKKAKVLIAELLRPEKESLLIGVTGFGGVGKSSLINRLIRAFRQEQKTVGVVVHDPVDISGGTALRDRLMMKEHTLDPGVFIRSLAQYKNFKGVTSETPDIVKIMRLMGKDVIILETVGVGQSDLGFKDLAETLLWVTMPGLGDQNQIAKGGVIRTADIIVVNKIDHPKSEAIFQILREEFGDSKKIYKTNSLNGQGIAELVEAIKEHKKSLLAKAAQ